MGVADDAGMVVRLGVILVWSGCIGGIDSFKIRKLPGHGGSVVER